MSSFAFALVFSAAFIHAVWNLLAKRSQGGAVFIFLVNLCSAVVYAPLAIAVFWGHPSTLNGTTLLFAMGSGVIHVLYFLALQRGYQAGDLSLVYPLARGIGPLLSTAIAIALLHERLTPLALVGIACIIGGVFGMTGNPHQFWSAPKRVAILYGVLTGMLIATYTIWDKVAVSQFEVSPILLNYGCITFEVILLAPLAQKAASEVKATWQQYRLETLGVAILSPLAYLLVLVALVSSPVSHVAPIRELSILVGTVLGHRLLAEGEITKRLISSGTIVVGIGLLALN